jgi:hypothetical protein
MSNHNSITAAGTSMSKVAQADEKKASNPPSKPELAANDSANASPADELFDQLNSLCVNHKIEEREKRSQAATYVAGQLALQGQITVFFAGPNTGKTLLALKLVSDAKLMGVADLNIYHLNLDDDEKGIIDKAHLGNQNGFNVMDSERLSKPLEYFEELVSKAVTTDAARRTLLILDTVKKFTDVMDKGVSSGFMTLCRRFTAAGGTIIALAHTNKRVDADGRPIPGGTSDVRDDCDCAYVMDIEREERVIGAHRRFVKFTNVKARGSVAREVTYSYETNDDGDYPRMFYSVKLSNPGEVEKLQCQEAIKEAQLRDQSLIQVIHEKLAEEPWSQTSLVNEIMAQTGASRSNVRGCLDRWRCEPDDGGLWVRTNGDNNAKVYQLPGTP